MAEHWETSGDPLVDDPRNAPPQGGAPPGSTLGPPMEYSMAPTQSEEPTDWWRAAKLFGTGAAGAASELGRTAQRWVVNPAMEYTGLRKAGEPENLLLPSFEEVRGDLRPQNTTEEIFDLAGRAVPGVALAAPFGPAAMFGAAASAAANAAVDRYASDNTALRVLASAVGGWGGGLGGRYLFNKTRNLASGVPMPPPPALGPIGRGIAGVSEAGLSAAGSVYGHQLMGGGIEGAIGAGLGAMAGPVIRYGGSNIVNRLVSGQGVKSLIGGAIGGTAVPKTKANEDALVDMPR